jgi:hypothetical protein
MSLAVMSLAMMTIAVMSIAVVAAVMSVMMVVVREVAIESQTGSVIKWNIRSRVAIIIRIRSDITPTQSAQESPA